LAYTVEVSAETLIKCSN